MTTGRRFKVHRASVMCVTRAWGGVGIAGALLTALVGCVPAHTAMESSGGMSVSAPAVTRLAQSGDDGSVRVEAIQRYDSQASNAVTGVVTVRNTSSAPRTVNVGVTWLGTDGSMIVSDGAARETVTLGPRESRELVFRGEQGSRDFKVAVSSAVQ